MKTTLSGLILTLVLGWAAGGAANWAADVLPRKCLAVKTVSHADAKAMSCFWLFPLHYLTLLWYYFYDGVCPHCCKPRPRRAPLLEIATIGFFGLAWWRFGGEPWRLAVVCLYAAFLLAVAVIDLEQRRVLNVMLAPAAGGALLFSLLPGQPGLLSAVIGAGMGFGAFWVLGLIGRGAVGMGDVKLAGAIGLMTGYPAVLTALLLGALLGGIAAGILLITRRADRKSKIAYAPYLAVGTAIVLLMNT